MNRTLLIPKSFAVRKLLLKEKNAEFAKLIYAEKKIYVEPKIQQETCVRAEIGPP